MNILFCNFDEEWHKSLIGGVASRLGANQVVSISVHDLELNSYVKNYEWIDSRDFNKKIYSFMNDKKLPALDAEIFDELRWCEALYYPMLDRIEVESLKSISYHERKRYYENDLRCMLWILENYKIDVCVFSTIPHISFDFALYGLCKYLGIKIVMGYFGIPIPHRSVTTFYMSDIFDPIPQLNDFKPTGKNDSKIKVPTRMQYYYDHYGRGKDVIKPFVYDSDYVVETNKLQSFLKLIRKKIKQRDLITSIRKKIVQYFVGKRMERYLNKYQVDKAEGKYIYYPLHYQPECTSLPMGGAYYNQIHVIRLLSQCLPEGVTLYVKPHPRRNLLTNEDFYDQIRELKNVKLLSSKANTYELIDNALAVVSLTGTAIAESLIRGIPVIMFGYHFWKYAPNVFHCASENDCQSAIKTICDGYTFNRTAFDEFLCKLDKEFVDGSLYSAYLKLFSISMEDNIKNVSDAMFDYIDNLMNKK